jgi:hypothetical protein|tara:strand:- start:3871 stop:4494 length:624 start_codon:yes stop_codon:yes gene_type:complete
MEAMKSQFKEMLQNGLEEQIRETAKDGNISNWKSATIVPVIGFIEKITDTPFIAGAYLLGQDEEGDAQLLCTEPSDGQLPDGVMEWVKSIMLMEGLEEEESICELLLDFHMAVVANDFDFQDANLMGWESVFEQIRTQKRSTNRRALSKIAEMGVIRDALKEMLSTFLGDLAEGLDNWTEKIKDTSFTPVAELNESGFSEEFIGEWE